MTTPTPSTPPADVSIPGSPGDMSEAHALRAVADAARVYFEHYVQDEAEDAEDCVCGQEQHERAAALRDALRVLKAATARAAAPVAGGEALKQCRDALLRAHQFITNGVELGFIRMPDDDTPDSAHETPQIVREAITAANAALSQPAPEASDLRSGVYALRCEAAAAFKQPASAGYKLHDLYRSKLDALLAARLLAVPLEAVPPTPLSHQLWAAAQLAPGEGIEDGAGRVAAILATVPHTPQPADIDIDALHQMVGWAYSKLHHVNYTSQDDALMLDRMKLLLEHDIYG